MKISILNFDLSDNSLGRAYIIAKALQRYYEVEIIGPAFKSVIWQPLSTDQSITYKVLTTRNINKIIQCIDGDVIYAIKPKGTSFGYALLAKRKLLKPLILDIDDWEVGFYQDWRLLGKLYSLAKIWDLNNIGFSGNI